MKNSNIEKLRESVVERLREYKKSGGKDHINLDIEKEILQRILFEDNKFAIPDNLWKLLDLSNVSFDGVDVRWTDFTGSSGVVINPQTVKNKSLWATTLTDVVIDGSFDDVNVEGVDFTGSKGAVLDPQTVKRKRLIATKLTDVVIDGSLDGAYVTWTDFTGSKGAIIMDLDVLNNTEHAILTDVKIFDLSEYQKTEEKIAKAFQKIKISK